MEIIKTIMYILGIIFLFIFILSNLVSIGFKKKIKKEIKSLRENQLPAKEGIITSSDIAHLPDNVRKWMVKSGVLGSTWKSYTYIEEKGYMKLDPSKEKWIFSSAKHYIGLHEPSFVWVVKAEFVPFFYTYGRDLFLDGIGALEMRVLNIFKVANHFNGVKLNQSTFQRYLMEMPWYPQAALNRNMKWSKVDSNTAKVIMSHRGITGEVYFYFDKEGNVIKTTSMRYKDIEANSPLYQCIGEVNETKMINKFVIPTKISITWKLPDFDYNWYNVEVVKIDYK